MKEFNTFKCPFCGSMDTDEQGAWRRCNICAVAWDRLYSDEYNKEILGAFREYEIEQFWMKVAADEL